MRQKILSLFLAFLLAACATTPTGITGAENAGDMTLEAVSFFDLPDWDRDDQSGALAAFRKSCNVMTKRSLTAPVAPIAIGGTIGDWQPACTAASLTTDAKGFFQEYFQPYRADTSLGRTGLFTGYYESQLNGSLVQGGPYQTPLYRKPNMAAGGYPDRAAIDAGALAGKGLELVWLDDADDAFFLHIQGSGRVRLADGRVLRVGYDGQNGYPYTAIGRELIARGELTRENVSLQTIRAWLKAHPDQAQALREKNPSYVFFRSLDQTGPDDGPTGAQSVSLTAQRSLAVDPRFIPYGTPVFLDAPHPMGNRPPIRQLLIAQDTGGAIKGPVRGDVFWGHGIEAENTAGLMKARGEMFLLLPKTLSGTRHIELAGR